MRGKYLAKCEIIPFLRMSSTCMSFRGMFIWISLIIRVTGKHTVQLHGKFEWKQIWGDTSTIVSGIRLPLSLATLLLGFWDNISPAPSKPANHLSNTHRADWLPGIGGKHRGKDLRSLMFSWRVDGGKWEHPGWRCTCIFLEINKKYFKNCLFVYEGDSLGVWTTSKSENREEKGEKEDRKTKVTQRNIKRTHIQCRNGQWCKLTACSREQRSLAICLEKAG